ncbi:flagellar basal body-associated protein FliL [Parashewanella spongiae]|uniref:Flagellar protein FliL n=1 Tax=Parashewanella spongiae TaxID=342950 RepID=A0A3A6UA55_9GAMM|nr:flagellar basal body-associated protein FliL [Parashewanella spongiae]MCL1077140.1 flagellar basal body-associated protein FliL [Parashewanella spongiae]RJY18837.1 flagellar basal body-associated protein FliL [Parashewanella spongiae]
MKQLVLAFLLTFTSIVAVHAEDSAVDDYAYYGFEPDIVTNYLSNRKKLGFVRVNVELMVRGKDDLSMIEHHEPLLRAAIIEILGNQTEAQIKSLSGRETMRQQCLETVNQLLTEEMGKKAVVNLLFTKYLYD